MADDDGAVRVAQDDLGTHVNEFVHKEESALKHLLMNQDAAVGLRCHHQQDAQQVGRESGPDGVGQRQD